MFTLLLAKARRDSSQHLPLKAQQTTDPQHQMVPHLTYLTRSNHYMSCTGQTPGRLKHLLRESRQLRLRMVCACDDLLGVCD